MIYRELDTENLLQVQLWENETSIWKYGDKFIIMLNNTGTTNLSIEIKIAIDLLLRAII
ncbi:hypothetical protein IA826_02205 [Listeria seeligeri]|uniref:hypothetical protein n=1 Tax=Listeria seeligeri TaxID=1640 RepID=UPI001629E211|nr:hypothetical protein [Listeria seeligeri]MBC2069889.1 hypothetical protein [Listeria seeligeri]MBC2087849.1 hypothetical protein [Listeria seeligeri]MBF2400543.1 hypothetical protein [Listeria seeligeri]MBF2499590.1 hypothetical protein [Listeria seeligeri]MBF2651842.1 hypothetical protein [Listeria seeligeri]